MRYAIISDIHANWQAWTAVLDDIRNHQVDAVICLGDVVGYGPRPEEVLTGVRQQTRNFVVGNHDAAACGQLDTDIFNVRARTVVEWTAKRLSPDALNFLRGVPLTLENEGILFVHAEVEQPDRFGYIDRDEVALDQFEFVKSHIVFIGHTHKPLAFCYRDGRVEELPDKDFQIDPESRYIINVGSVGEPRDREDIRACYVLYDSSSRAVNFRKVRFDVEAYRKDLEAVGLEIEPYFVAMIDHEASQGRDLLDEVEDTMLPVPATAVFTGNKTAAQTVQLSNPVPEKISDPLMAGLPEPPKFDAADSVTYTQNTVSTGGVTSQSNRPATSEASNMKGMIIFIVAVVVAALVVGLLILMA